MTVLLYLFVAVLLATGLSLLWLGATLLMLGGSPYYVLAGVAITLSAILIARRNWSGVWVYAAFWLATLLWALWESGLDGWALAPRLAMPTALGWWMRSEEHTSELQSLMRISYAVFSLKKKKQTQ